MKKQCIQHRLFQTFKTHPHSTAIECGDRVLTYACLEQRAAALCRRLINNHIPPGHLIGVYMSDRIDFITAVLGILAARCVFVPLDNTLPIKRIRKMLRFTHATIVFTDNKTKTQLESTITHGSGDSAQTIRVVPVQDIFKEAANQRNQAKE